MKLSEYSKEIKASEILVGVGLLAFAWYKYSKMTEQEKENIHEDLKGIAEKVAKEFIPEQVKPFLPAHWK